ncbi:MAG: hypothetical protein V4503_04530 [Gemmatimonadota bacterium]
MRSWLLLTLFAGSVAQADAQKASISRSSFALLANSLGAITINRVYYGLDAAGDFGIDSTNNFTRGGGFWPKGTLDQYMFKSGLQVSGIIAGAKSASNPWGGDTTGGLFFDPAGSKVHGAGLTPLYNSHDPVTAANWPDYARVPSDGAAASLFDPSLRGRVSASEGDVWYLAWEGDPASNTGRPHPLGIAIEVRVLGWNGPVGNDDIVYALVTYYNISSAVAADYASYRPGLRDKLLEAGQKFQQLNNTKFGITLPLNGYSISPFYSSAIADPDVGAGASNFASVNIPFAMSYTWDATFSAPSGWSFDPAIFGKPFFPGAGFLGVKYLRTGAGTSAPAIQLFSNITGGGAFPTPSNVNRLFRYQSGEFPPDFGVQCNQGVVSVSHTCFVITGPPYDARVLQSVPAVTLSPGGSTTVGFAFLHAAPLALAGYAPGTQVTPGQPTRNSDAALLANGANRVDSIAGFAGYTDANGDGVVQPGEVWAVPRSLLAKAQLAQAVFDSKFLLPAAPDAPDFFLIPGDNRVTVVWRPSSTETFGDPYYDLAKNPTMTPPGGGMAVPNPLYDPNFRKFDVEGYRIYRGRSDSPGSLTLVAEYDYAGTTFDDYDGRVPLGRNCALELGVTTTCADVFDPIVPGIARLRKRSYDINANLLQVRLGDRTLVESGDVLILHADSMGRGLSPAALSLYNSGVPFTWVDNSVRNTGAYYYAVTAFDYNSIQSGPTMQESSRIPKRVTPQVLAGNYTNTAVVEQGVYGRHGLLTDNISPTLDAAGGRFSKQALPGDGLKLYVPGFLKELFRTSGEARMTLDSIVLGSQVEGVTQAATHHLSVTTPNGVTHLAVPVAVSLRAEIANTSGSFTALTVDPGVATQFGSNGNYSLRAIFSLVLPGGYYTTLRARGCFNGAGGYLFGNSCFNNGSRWFTGGNETQPNPNTGNAGTISTGIPTTNFNNAGELPAGVAALHEPTSYNDRPGIWRVVEGALAPFAGAADYRVYWSGGLTIDSVVDLTHDVKVPFSPRIGASWGILNPGAVSASQSYDQRTALTASDITCVEPLKSVATVQNEMPCSGSPSLLTNSAVLGQVVLDHAFSGNIVDRTAPAAGLPGFGLYLKGHFYLLSLSSQSGFSNGTQWTMRDYVGAIQGGNGSAGNFGNYSFSTQGQPRPLTAVGASVALKFEVVNSLAAVTAETLEQVHTVPDPYYVGRSATESSIRFIHLPEKATIRIYTAAGRLIRVLKQDSAVFGGEVTWDLLTRDNKPVGSGVYFYHVTATGGATRIGRMTVVRVVQ